MNRRCIAAGAEIVSAPGRDLRAIVAQAKASMGFAGIDVDSYTDPGETSDIITDAIAIGLALREARKQERLRKKSFREKMARGQASAVA